MSRFSRTPLSLIGLCSPLIAGFQKKWQLSALPYRRSLPGSAGFCAPSPSLRFYPPTFSLIPVCLCRPLLKPLSIPEASPPAFPPSLFRSEKPLSAPQASLCLWLVHFLSPGDLQNSGCLFPGIQSRLSRTSSASARPPSPDQVSCSANKAGKIIPASSSTPESSAAFPRSFFLFLFHKLSDPPSRSIPEAQNPVRQFGKLSWTE